MHNARNLTGLTASGYVQAVVRVPVITPNGVEFSFLLLQAGNCKLASNKCNMLSGLDKQLLVKLTKACTGAPLLIRKSSSEPGHAQAVPVMHLRFMSLSGMFCMQYFGMLAAMVFGVVYTGAK